MISGLASNFYYLYDLCTCSVLDETHFINSRIQDHLLIFKQLAQILVPLQGNGKAPVEVLKLRGLVYTLKGQTSFMALLSGIERI